jgi:hypothetical protein
MSVLTKMRLTTGLAALAVAVPLAASAPSPAAAGVAGPGPAGSTAVAPAPSDAFAASVRTAARTVVPSATVGATSEQSRPSFYDPTLSVRKTTSRLHLGPGTVIVVKRQVGAQSEITAQSLRGAGRAEYTVPLHRPGAGARTGYVASSGTAERPGLTTVSWNERPGVTYTVIGRGGVSVDVLRSLANGLPADASQVSAREVAAMRAGVTRRPATSDSAASGDIAVLGGSRLYVDSDGPYTQDEDWRNEREQCSTNCAYRFSNYTAMWQMVLWADIFDVTFDHVTCNFDATTAANTRRWQEAEGLVQDGRAGPNTHSAADDYLAIDEADPNDGGDMYLDYTGNYAEVTFHRWDYPTYRYDMLLLGDWRGLWYQVVNYFHCQ